MELAIRFATQRKYMFDRIIVYGNFSAHIHVSLHHCPGRSSSPVLTLPLHPSQPSATKNRADTAYLCAQLPTFHIYINIFLLCDKCKQQRVYAHIYLWSCRRGGASLCGEAIDESVHTYPIIGRCGTCVCVCVFEWLQTA